MKVNDMQSMLNNACIINYIIYKDNGTNTVRSSNLQERTSDVMTILKRQETRSQLIELSSIY